MAYESFDHIDPDEFHGNELTLHDCVANNITYKNNTLRFCFPDGFWVTTHHKANLSGKVVRTDAAAVDFPVNDIHDIILHVFTRHRWLWFRKTTVKIWDMEQLIAFVNSGKCTVEFITQYRTYGEQMWHCAIRSNKKPYYRECWAFFPDTSPTFYWNNLCLDRQW